MLLIGVAWHVKVHSACFSDCLLNPFELFEMQPSFRQPDSIQQLEERDLIVEINGANEYLNIIHHLRCSPVLIMKIHRQETFSFKVCCRLYFTEFNVAPDHSLKGAVEVPPSIFCSLGVRESPSNLSRCEAADSRSKPLPQRAQFDPRSGKESRSSEVMDPRSLVSKFSNAFKRFLKAFFPLQFLTRCLPCLAAVGILQCRGVKPRSSQRD